MPVEILKLEDRPGSLRLTYQVDPKKDAYFVNDELTIHLMARNNGDVALDDVSIDLTEALKAVAEEKGIALSKIDRTHLEPGETAALDCTYRVSAGDAEMEKFELSFASTALTAETRAPARSFNALVTGKVDEIRRRHGNNNIELIYTGQEKVTEAEGLFKVLSDEDNAGRHTSVLNLQEGVTTNEALSELLRQGIVVNSFKELIPRMNDIFIKLVTQEEA